MDRCLSPAEVQALTGLSRSTLWRLERRGELPARRRLSAGRVAWLESEISQWLESRSRGLAAQ